MIHASKVIPAVVADVIRKAPLSPGKVAFAWRMAVGPVIDKATRVQLSDDGILHVTADSPAWLDAVRKSSGLIRSRLAGLLGDDAVSRIEYR